LCFIAWPALLAASSLDYQKTFGGNGAVSIAAVATDAAGNVYIAGTTTAFDFPVKNAYQPRNPGTAAVVSRDAGQTWSPLGFIPDIPYTGVEAPRRTPRIRTSSSRRAFMASIAARTRAPPGRPWWT